MDCESRTIRCRVLEGKQVVSDIWGLEGKQVVGDTEGKVHTWICRLAGSGLVGTWLRSSLLAIGALVGAPWLCRPCRAVGRRDGW